MPLKNRVDEQFSDMPRTRPLRFRRPTFRVGRGLVEEVGVGVFDAVVVGDWEAVGVRVVDGGGKIKGGSRTAPTVRGGGG